MNLTMKRIMKLSIMYLFPARTVIQKGMAVCRGMDKELQLQGFLHELGKITVVPAKDLDC